MLSYCPLMTSTHCTDAATYARLTLAFGTVTALNSESAPHMAEYEDGVCIYCGAPERALPSLAGLRLSL